MTGETLTALRALTHCERRFYLAEVEGHALHRVFDRAPDTTGAIEATLADDTLGLRGRVLATIAPLRVLVHRPRRCPTDAGDPMPCPVDRMHAVASSLLLGAHRRAAPPPIELCYASGERIPIDPTPEDIDRVRGLVDRPGRCGPPSNARRSTPTSRRASSARSPRSACPMRSATPPVTG